MQPDFKYDLALLNKVSGTPWAPRRSTYNPSFATLLDTQLQPSEKRRSTQDFGQQTNATDDIVAEPATKQQRTTPPPRLPSTSTSSSRPLPDSPVATSPTGRQHPPLPAPPRQALRRLTPAEVMQPTKAQKTSKDTTIRSTEQATKEPPPLRQKINAVTLPNGKSITPYTNDDTSEDQPIIFDNEGYDETQLLEGMKHESNQMKLHDVYDEVDASTVDDNVIREAIPARWVHRKKGPQAEYLQERYTAIPASRIVAKGCTEKIEDEDSVYASTPMFTTLRTLTSRTTNVTTKLDSATR